MAPTLRLHSEQAPGPHDRRAFNRCAFCYKGSYTICRHHRFVGAFVGGWLALACYAQDIEESNNHAERISPMTTIAISTRQIARYIALICTLVAALVVTSKPSYAATTLRPLQFTAQVLNTTSPAKMTSS